MAVRKQVGLYLSCLEVPPAAGLSLRCRSGAPLTNDQPKYEQKDVETKVLAILT